MDLNEMIIDVAVSSIEDGKIKLKYLAISGGCGPEIIMDQALAYNTVVALQAALKGTSDVMGGA